jgi:acyl-coenzyme A synthetase/AMP-(fatty) acid ligase
MNSLALVERPRSEPFARRGEQTITVGQFCADVACVARALPEGDHLINLCQDRYRFTVTFFAALVRGQTNLLPARRDDAELARLQHDYSQSFTVSDDLSAGADVHLKFEPGRNGDSESPRCAPQAIAAIAFTSGSTGEPQAHHKSWQMLDTWRHVHYRYLPDRELDCGLVATVPSWHMYGLEWALLLPTIAPLTLYCGADFYPQDVAAAMNAFDEPVILVSTPVHLRALCKSTTSRRTLKTIICATAPLAARLAAQFEQHFDSRVFEIYGCSEIGSLACRYPTEGETWSFFDCFKVNLNHERITISHPHLQKDVVLADAFAQTEAGQYRLLGRTSDLIKVAGKRESLAHLNTVLTGIAGIEDGVIYDPAALGLEETGRLAAFVVAPDLKTADIRAALAREIDSTFIPRPIRHVLRIPRDNTSKLKRAELKALAHKLSGNQ